MALLIITTVVALTSTLAVAVAAHRSPCPELAQAQAAANTAMAELTGAVKAADTANRLALARLAAAAVSHAQG